VKSILKKLLKKNMKKKKILIFDSKMTTGMIYSINQQVILDN